MPKLEFPKNFVWGAATASYQIEGAAFEDGKGESIWDRFSHTPGKVTNGDTGDVACDHYHRYPEDIELMKKLGINSYRLSIAWPRIFPEGRGSVNSKGVDFYIRLCEGLVNAGIDPAVTLYHWDLPQKLMDMGGWANRDVPRYFADYAAVIYEKLGPYVKRWFTLNEPNVVAYVGCKEGRHAPGISDPAIANQVAHHLLLGHGLAHQAFIDGNHQGQLGIVVDVWPMLPSTDLPEDKVKADEINAWNLCLFLDPIFKGRYPANVWENKAGGPGFEPVIHADDMKIIHKPADLIGLNNYSSRMVGAKADEVMATYPVTHMNWAIIPRGIYEVCSYMKDTYGDVPLFITENGAAFQDSVDAQGRVADSQRIEYLQQYIGQVHRAIQDGVNLQGYYCWSLMDNFEWAHGYGKRFGLIYIDYETLKRYPKDSFYWYQNLIRQNAFVTE